MSDLLDLPPVTDRPAALTIADLLAGVAPITRRDLNNAMIAAFGGSDADGRWTQRDSFEMLEHALALYVARHLKGDRRRQPVRSTAADCQALPDPA